jgi:hypothetical protein
MSSEYMLIKKTQVKEIYKLNDRDIKHLPYSMRTNRMCDSYTPAQLYQLGPIRRLSKSKREAAERKRVSKQETSRFKVGQKEETRNKRAALLKKHLLQQGFDMGNLSPDQHAAIIAWKEKGRPATKVLAEQIIAGTCAIPLSKQT